MANSTSPKLVCTLKTGFFNSVQTFNFGNYGYVIFYNTRLVIAGDTLGTNALGHTLELSRENGIAREYAT